MSDPLRRVVQGEPWVPSAKRENLITDTIRQVQGNGRTGGQRGVGERSRDYVLIENATGGDLDDEHAVVGLGELLITPTDHEGTVFERPVFAGEVPAETHEGKFAILVGPAKDGDVVKAVGSGVAWVRLRVNDPDHEFADIEAGEWRWLQSAPSGSAQILATTPDTDSSSSSDDGSSSDDAEFVWAVVRLGGGSGGRGRVVPGILQDGLTAADDPATGATTAQVQLLVRDEETAGQRTEGDVITAVNRSPNTAAPAGTFVIVMWADFEWLLVWVDCDAESGSSS